MEAQSCGLPVIGSNVGGIPSLIKNNETGLLVEPEDSSALSDAILRLVADKELYLRIGEQARQHALSNYSSETMIKKMENVYMGHKI
jgi:glycosyltransferase involved in cell wall biosynthesis